MPDLFRVKTSQFFDRPKVIKRVKPAKRRWLARAGGLVRTIARRSIRKRKGVSAPGRPPHSHEGSLRNLIFFGIDSEETVIVGPQERAANRTGRTTPNLLEFGGTVLDEDGRPQTYEARPFMGPALEKATPKLAPMWSDSVKA